MAVISCSEAHDSWNLTIRVMVSRWMWHCYRVTQDATIRNGDTYEWQLWGGEPVVWRDANTGEVSRRLSQLQTGVETPRIDILNTWSPRVR